MSRVIQLRNSDIRHSVFRGSSIALYTEPVENISNACGLQLQKEKFHNGFILCFPNIVIY
jgi:hypothetical protein